MKDITDSNILAKEVESTDRKKLVKGILKSPTNFQEK